MQVRAAQGADVDGLAQLERDLFGSDAWSADQVRAEVDGPSSRVVVVTEPSGAPTGYVVTRWSGDAVDLLRVAVRADHQRRGLAGILLADVVASAREAGADRIMLEVSDANAAAVELYRGHGFETVDRRRRYYADDSDALVMMRTLERLS